MAYKTGTSNKTPCRKFFFSFSPELEEMNLSIFLVSISSFLTVTGVNVCQTGVKDISNNYDYHVSSPNYPNKYPGYLDCMLTIHCPSNSLIKLEILEFVTETNFDYLNITIGETTIKLSGELKNKHYLGINNVSNVTFFFHTNNTNEISPNVTMGFNVSYSFIPIPKFVLEDLHGEIIPLSKTNISKFYSNEIMKETGWYRFIYMHFRKCLIISWILK